MEEDEGIIVGILEEAMRPVDMADEESDDEMNGHLEDDILMDDIFR